MTNSAFSTLLPDGIGREHPWSSHSLMHGIWFSYRGPYKLKKDKNTLKSSPNWSA